MVRKKVEGDEEQRRAAAREARRAGDEPSARSATTGASKQRAHRGDRASLTHGEKLDARHQGKQGRSSTGGRAGDRAAAGRPAPVFAGRRGTPYGEGHERVLRALATAEEEHPGRAVHLQDVSRAAGLPEEETRGLLHDLVAVHRLATEIQDSGAGGLGPRYEAKPRR